MDSSVDSRVGFDHLRRALRTIDQPHISRTEFVTGGHAGPPQDLRIQLADQIDIHGDGYRDIGIDLLRKPHRELCWGQRKSIVVHDTVSVDDC